MWDDVKSRVRSYIKGLEAERDALLDQRNAMTERINAIGAEIATLNKFAAACKGETQEKIRERSEDMNRVCPELVDNRDAAKINIFTEAIERLGDDLSGTNIRNNMPKLNYYIYNPKWKLWTDINDFRNDYRAWIDCSGYWGNLPQRSEGVRSGLRIAQ